MGCVRYGCVHKISRGPPEKKNKNRVHNRAFYFASHFVPRKLKKMSITAMGLCDGKGAIRVAGHMFEQINNGDLI